MKYPRYLTIIAAILAPLLLILLVLDSPALSEAARDGLQFGMKIDLLIIMFVALMNGVRLWNHQSAMNENVDRNKMDIAKLTGYQRWMLAIVGLMSFVAIPVLTSILFTLNQVR